MRSSGRRRRRLGGLSLCLCARSMAAAAASSASSSSSGSVLGRDRDWWLDTVHLDEDFAFDGSHSDFAQQFYRLFLDGASDAQAPVEIAQLDAAMAADVDARLQASKRELAPLEYAELSPLLQRALLWDLGIVKAGDVEFTQILTTCGLRMAELAVSKAQYEAVGCTAQACSTPTGELYYQSLQCNGFQMNNASRCLTTRGKSPIHASMWSNGGDEWTLPDAFVAKHEWNESPNSFVVYAIHLQDDPNFYGKCVAPSMTVPCIASEKLDERARSGFCKPKPSRLVTQWIRAESAIAAAAKTSTSPSSLEIGLSIALAAFLLLVVGWWIWKRRRERKRRLTGDGRPKNTVANDATESEEDGGGVSYFFTEESTRGRNKRRGMGDDPHGTAVLGASFISGFDKVSSFPQPPTGQVADDPSMSLAHEDMARGCGATYARHSVYGSSNESPKRGRHGSIEKSGLSVSAIEERPQSPTYASNSSTYVSTNADMVTDPYRWSTLRPDGTSATVSSQSFGQRTGSEGQSDSSPLGNLLHDRVVMAKRVPYIDVSVSRQLSKGAYGEVWVGRMRDKLVAVKRLVPERRTVPKDLENFIAEIRLMAQFEHANVMALLGVAWNSPSNLCMMMEFLEKGDLKSLLKSWSSAELTWKQAINTDHLTERQVEGSGKKTAIAIDVANGLRYLHNLTPRVVHRDLKSHNILLSQDLVAKLCDFGVSRVNEGMDTMTCGVGTAFWTAPEVLVGDKYSETADVYSFGVVLTELDSHQLPFHDAVDKDTGQRIETMHLMHLVCLGEISPSVSTHCPDTIRLLAEDCMNMEPSRRPTVDEIIRRLAAFSGNESMGQHGRRTSGPALDSSLKLPSSRRRTRLSSGFSIHDNGDGSSPEEDFASSWHSPDDRTLLCKQHDEAHDMSTGSIVTAESPRNSGDSDSGAIWI